MFIDVIKGFLVGVCASAPLGPIGIFVIQKSLSEGHKSGFIAGLGSTLVDAIFAVIAIFALALVEDFINTHRVVILIAGGLVVGLFGVYMTFSDPFRKMKGEDPHPYSVKDFLSAVAMGITNPGGIFLMFAMFAFFGIEVGPNKFEVMPIILAVAGGSAAYWFTLSWGLGHLRRNFKLSTLLWINKISGIVLMIIGLALLAEGLLKIIFL